VRCGNGISGGAAAHAPAIVGRYDVPLTTRSTGIAATGFAA